MLTDSNIDNVLALLSFLGDAVNVDSEEEEYNHDEDKNGCKVADYVLKGQRKFQYRKDTNNEQKTSRLGISNIIKKTIKEKPKKKKKREEKIKPSTPIPTPPKAKAPIITPIPTPAKAPTITPIPTPAKRKKLNSTQIFKDYKLSVEQRRKKKQIS